LPFNNTDITILFSQNQAILINMAGSPSWIQIPNTGLKRVPNTRTYIVTDETGKIYLHIFDGFLVPDSTNQDDPVILVEGDTEKTRRHFRADQNLSHRHPGIHTCSQCYDVCPFEAP